MFTIVMGNWSLAVNESFKENMTAKQKHETQIIVTQVGFGEGVSGRGSSISKASKPQCEGG